MSKSTKNRRKVVKAALKELDLETLQVDPSYQREVKAKHAKIIAEFDPNALGIPLIGERADGSLWIVDGLQRITALRKMGRKWLRGEVFASKGAEHEAQVFKLVNINRTKLTPGEEFRALLTAHDPIAWDIKNAVESCGFKIVLGKTGASPETRSKELTCINTLRGVAKKWGTDPIKFALEAVKDAWTGDPMATYNHVIDGLCRFYNRHEGAVDTDKFYPRLRTVRPQQIIHQAGMSIIGSGGMGDAVADVLEKVLRKKITSKKGS